MAKLYITEYNEIGLQLKLAYAIQAALEPALVDQTPVAIGSEAKSAAFGATTTFVRLHADAICSVKFGASPTATTNNRRMAADQTEYFAVVPGQKVSVISNT